MSTAAFDPARIAVLISGFGSNLQALLDAQDRGELTGQVCTVISDQADAYGLERARLAGIDAIHVDPGAFTDREAFDHALANTLEDADVGLVVLAGFMRILSAGFVDRFAGRMLNVHPSLLPRFRGLHTHKRVLQAGDAHHGATVHFVTAELDGGPRVIQYKITVKPGDTPDTLSARVQAGEHIILPRATGWFAAGRLTMNDQQAKLDGQPLAQPIVIDADVDP